VGIRKLGIELNGLAEGGLGFGEPPFADEVTAALLVAFGFGWWGVRGWWGSGCARCGAERELGMEIIIPGCMGEFGKESEECGGVWLLFAKLTDEIGQRIDRMMCTAIHGMNSDRHGAASECRLKALYIMTPSQPIPDEYARRLMAS